MSNKSDLLKPHLQKCVDRLKRFIEIDAPGVVIGAEAFHVLATTLAAYGISAGSTMVQHIADQNLHARGICSHGDCVVPVVRPGLGMCPACRVEILGPDNGESTTIAE